MRKEHFTKTKAYIFAECAKYVGYLTADELLRIHRIMVDLAESEPDQEEERGPTDESRRP